MPKGRVLPSPLGICIRSPGLGVYRPVMSNSCRRASSSASCAANWRTVTWSTPALPLFDLTLRQAASRLAGAWTLSISANQTPPFTPVPRAASIRFVQTLRSTHAHWAGMSAPCLARSAGTGGVNSRSGCLSIAHHLPASLRSTGITPLQRYYGCSDSCAAGFRNSLNLDRRSEPHRSPFFTYNAFQPFRLQPPDGPPLSLCDATSVKLFNQKPPALSAQRINSRLRAPIAVSPSRPAESSSLSYGLAIRPLLLSTPHRCDAVTKATER